MEIKVQRLTKMDIILARQLFMLMQEVFEVNNPKDISDEYLQKLLETPVFICFAATYNNQVAGGLTAYELLMYDAEKSEIFIYDIAVSDSHQRKGVGKALLDAVKDYAKQHNIKTLFVNANEEDTHALDFYRSAGVKGENVVQFTYDIN